jgi:hypothetical protein
MLPCCVIYWTKRRYARDASLISVALPVLIVLRQIVLA